MSSIPKRYVMGIMCFLGMFQMYFARLVSSNWIVHKGYINYGLDKKNPEILGIWRIIKNINIAILAMADAPEQNLQSDNMTSMSVEVNDVTCPENENYFSKANSSLSNLSKVFKMIFCHRHQNRCLLSTKTDWSVSAENKEFTMTNVQQMNLIGFYYHGYVPMHIISRQSLQINLDRPLSILLDRPHWAFLDCPLSNERPSTLLQGRPLTRPSTFLILESKLLNVHFHPDNNQFIYSHNAGTRHWTFLSDIWLEFIYVNLV